MKEMRAPRDNRNRKCLRTRPVEHVFQQHGVVLLTVNDQGFQVRCRVNRRGRRAADAGADQHQFVDVVGRVQALERVRGDVGAK